MAQTKASNTNEQESPEDAARRMAGRVLDLEQENESLRARVAELEADAAARPDGPRPAPVRASFGLTEGTRLELEAARDRGDGEFVTRDPFTGDTLTIADLGTREG